MKTIYTLTGLLTGLIMTSSPADSTIEPAKKPATIFIETQNDYCAADNIGIVNRLTIKDIEGLIK